MWSMLVFEQCCTIRVGLFPTGKSLTWISSVIETKGHSYSASVIYMYCITQLADAYMIKRLSTQYSHLTYMYAQNRR